ncbi:MAG: DciA family protein [Bacillota bacterium]
MDPVRLGFLLDQVTAKMGLAAKLRQGLAVFLWPQVVGKEIARQTSCGPVLRGLLFVKTPNPALAHQLTLMEKEILLRYRKIMGGSYLRGIRVKIGQLEEEKQEEPSFSAAPAETKPLPPEKEAKIKELAGKIPDPELAAVFFRAAAAWARGKRGAQEAEEEYIRLMLGDTWPTGAEVRALWERLDPARREAIRAKIEEELRQKILRRLADRPLSTATRLSLRGDLRRLAFLRGFSPTGISRELVADLLGPEAAREWPERDG